MVKKYIKKPIEVEALQWTGENLSEVEKFTNGQIRHEHGGVIYVKTLEGDMYAYAGAYIIKGVNGEFYPCKGDIFEKTYSEVGE